MGVICSPRWLSLTPILAKMYVIVLFDILLSSFCYCCFVCRRVYMLIFSILPEGGFFFLLCAKPTLVFEILGCFWIMICVGIYGGKAKIKKINEAKKLSFPCYDSNTALWNSRLFSFIFCSIWHFISLLELLQKVFMQNPIRRKFGKLIVFYSRLP